MANTITLRRRINSIKSTRQITKAMQLVSAAKLRRAQNLAEASRDYRLLVEDYLNQLAAITEINKSKYFTQSVPKQKLYIIVTSNSGLAGAYNSNIYRELTKSLKADSDQQYQVKFIVIGNKGAQFVRRLAVGELLAVYNSYQDDLSQFDVRPLLKLTLEQFETTTGLEVVLIYNQLVSIVKQKVQNLSLLPIKYQASNNLASPDNVQTKDLSYSNFEPDIETVLDEVANRLILAKLWQALVESRASEHAMRMMATKNATDNANDLIDDYTLLLNNVRQASITQELAEITGGAEAL